MKNANETSLVTTENIGLLVKIVNFFKNLFKGKQVDYIVSNSESNNNEENKDNFRKSIKFNEDPDREKLLKIQDELEKRGINEKNAYELTKYLSENQKEKLELLYKEQIREFEQSIQIYKNKIILIRKRLAHN